MILPNTSTFQGRIKYLRILKGLTQAELAERLSIHKQTVSSWESGRNEPKPTQLSHVAKTFGVPLLWLAEGRGDLPTELPPE